MLIQPHPHLRVPQRRPVGVSHQRTAALGRAPRHGENTSTGSVAGCPQSSDREGFREEAKEGRPDREAGRTARGAQRRGARADRCPAQL